jgi:hypothetical protein
MDWMFSNCSATAQRGALDWVPKFKKASLPVFKDLYKAVKNQDEARRVLKACGAKNDQERLAKELKAIHDSEMWQADAASGTGRSFFCCLVCCLGRVYPMSKQWEKLDVLRGEPAGLDERRAELVEELHKIQNETAAEHGLNSSEIHARSPESDKIGLFREQSADFNRAHAASGNSAGIAGAGDRASCGFERRARQKEAGGD